MHQCSWNLAFMRVYTACIVPLFTCAVPCVEMPNTYPPTLFIVEKNIGYDFQMHDVTMTVWQCLSLWRIFSVDDSEMGGEGDDYLYRM